MSIRPFILALGLLTPLALRAAESPATRPAFQEPAALQPFLKSGVATYAAYGGPNETYLKFTNDWNGTEADLAHFNEFTTSSTVSISGDKNAALILPRLAAMPVLECIILSDVTLSPAQIKLLASLKLKMLTLQTPATTLTLDGFVNLEMLSFGGPLEHVTLTNIPSLWYLAMGAATKTTAKSTLEIPSAPKLKTLALQNLALAEFSLSPTLQDVDFSDSTVPDAVLEQIPRLKNLHSLTLVGVENADVALSRFSDSRRAQLLRTARQP